MSRKKRRRLIDELFGGSPFQDSDKVFDEFEKGEGKKSGYSVSVSQTPQGTRIYAKVGRDTDVNALRRQLQQQYPGAQIEIEGGQPLIREISTKPVEEEEKEEEKQ